MLALRDEKRREIMRELHQRLLSNLKDGANPCLL